jgi:tRNA-guanine family transglycosylase
MVSLAKLSVVTEEGVLFENPFVPGEQSLLTPEESMRIQHSIGAVSCKIRLIFYPF